MFLEDKNTFNALRGIIELLLQDQLLRKPLLVNLNENLFILASFLSNHK